MTWRSEGDEAARLFDGRGRRKYLSRSERARFLTACARADQEEGTFGRLLAYSGCRLSEALALTPARLDAEMCRVVLRTLKRRRIIFRAVPVPSDHMSELAALGAGKQPDDPLWDWCRQTAWRHVKRLMDEAGIQGAQAMPKGLRHGFGIANAEHNVPAALTRVWMGHARIETTAIYQHAVGEEERAFAERLWAGQEPPMKKGSRNGSP